MRNAAVLVFALLTVMPGGAQWLGYPTAGVPKLANGKPNLSAPAPRATDGKPDLSGIWVDEENRPCPPFNCDDMLTPQEFCRAAF